MKIKNISSAGATRSEIRLQNTLAPLTRPHRFPSTTPPPYHTAPSPVVERTGLRDRIWNRGQKRDGETGQIREETEQGEKDEESGSLQETDANEREKRTKVRAGKI
jgi:hypothetical protein